MIFLQYLSDVFDYIDDAVMLVSKENSRYNLIMANKSFFAISDYSKSDEGKYVDELVPEKEYTNLRAQYENVSENKLPLAFRSKTGEGDSLKYYSSKLIPILDSFDKCTHIVVVSKDITEVEKLKAEIQQLKSTI